MMATNYSIVEEPELENFAEIFRQSASAHYEIERLFTILRAQNVELKEKVRQLEEELEHVRSEVRLTP